MLPEIVKCEKCEKESARLVKILSTEKPKRQKEGEGNGWVYLADALILIYECPECGNKFKKIIRKI